MAWELEVDTRDDCVAVLPAVQLGCRLGVGGYGAGSIEFEDSLRVYTSIVQGNSC